MGFKTILNAKGAFALLMVASSSAVLCACDSQSDSNPSSPVCGEHSFSHPTYSQEGYFAGRNQEDNYQIFFLTVKAISENEYREANGKNVLFDYATCKYFSLGLSYSSLRGESLTTIPLIDMQLYIDGSNSFYAYADKDNKIAIFSSIEINAADSTWSGASYYLNYVPDEKTLITAILYRVDA